MEPLTVENIHNFVAAWFHALDIHASAEECWKFLADFGLEMHFPGVLINDYASFSDWYVGDPQKPGVIYIFFDENHSLHTVHAEISSDQAIIDLVVGWQASWITPPDAKAKRTSMNATQRWKVRRSQKNAFGLEVTFYNAIEKPFEYAAGFATLD